VPFIEYLQNLAHLKDKFNVMEEYGRILLIVMPFFLLLIFIERTYGYFKGIDYSPIMDSLSNISSGAARADKREEQMFKKWELTRGTKKKSRLAQLIGIY